MKSEAAQVGPAADVHAALASKVQQEIARVITANAQLLASLCAEACLAEVWSACLASATKQVEVSASQGLPVVSTPSRSPEKVVRLSSDALRRLEVQESQEEEEQQAASPAIPSLSRSHDRVSENVSGEELPEDVEHELKALQDAVAALSGLLSKIGAEAEEAAINAAAGTEGSPSADALELQRNLECLRRTIEAAALPKDAAGDGTLSLEDEKENFQAWFDAAVRSAAALIDESEKLRCADRREASRTPPLSPSTIATSPRVQSGSSIRNLESKLLQALQASSS